MTMVLVVVWCGVAACTAQAPRGACCALWQWLLPKGRACGPGSAGRDLGSCKSLPATPWPALVAVGLLGLVLRCGSSSLWTIVGVYDVVDGLFVALFRLASTSRVGRSGVSGPSPMALCPGAALGNRGPAAAPSFGRATCLLAEPGVWGASALL